MDDAPQWSQSHNKGEQDRQRYTTGVDHRQQQISLPTAGDDGRVPHTLSQPLQEDDGLRAFKGEAKPEERKTSVHNEEKKPSAISLSVDIYSQLSFPQKLMTILDIEALSDIIAWLPHGRGFRVHDQARFEKEVCPTYFGQQSKFASFARKLNRWNFSRVVKGADAGSFFHPSFRRGGKALCAKITCGTGTPGRPEPMDPAIALSLATPGMIRHGLIDHGDAKTLPPPSDPNSVPYFGIDPKFLQPTPIHPRLDSRRHSTGLGPQNQSPQNRSLMDSFGRRHSLPSQTDHSTQEHFNPIGRPGLQQYQQGRLSYIPSHGRLFADESTSMGHSISSSGSARQDAAQSVRNQEEQHPFGIHSSLNPELTLGRSHRCAFGSGGFVSVSSKKSCYSDLFESSQPPNQLESLEESDTELIAHYLQRYSEQSGAAEDGEDRGREDGNPDIEGKH